MTVRLILAAALVLTGCGQAAPVAARLAASLSGTSSAPPAAKPAAAAPKISVLMRQRGVQFNMAQIEQDGAHRVYASNDGAQLVLTSGILSATRGFGGDLMSSQAPDLATLTDATPQHRRVRHFLDGADTPQRVSFDCTVARADPVPADAGLHLVETCTSDSVTTRNDYWIGSGQSVVKSREFVSTRVGYVEIETPRGG